VNEPSLPEESIFARALEIPSATERVAFLDRACGHDPALRAGVEALLRAHGRSGDLLDVPEDAVTAEQPARGGPDTLIGPYKLLEQIGEGGFGAVFMAEQIEPVRRRVALKVLKPGMDSRQVVARFEAERQALALMDHPNIARVLDGGQTAAGRPFFVMELVRGVPITQFCDHERLGVRERLILFADVCRAVQHAHQKGVIHRDLKPSNVLVTRHDDRAVVKVIDFGIAKALDQQLTDKTMFTGFGQMIGTPLYMSPEQAGLSGLDVDTRSDVYSLGVLLYELLTGTTPFERERMRGVGYDEIRRILREEEPPRPSTRLSTVGPAAVTASEKRKSDPRRLRRLLRGDLDWVVMKCLEKDRARRYETASALAADVERYLAGEPVLAGPPGMRYRLRKFLARNKRPVLAASAILLLLVLGIVGTTAGLLQALADRDAKHEALQQKDAALQQTRAEREEKEKARQKAVALAGAKAQALRKRQQALNMLTHEVVEDLLGRQVRLTDRHREFLRKVLAEHADFAAARDDDPEVRQSRAEGYFNVGLIRHRLGERKEAEAAYQGAAKIQKRLAAKFPGRPEYRYGLAPTLNNLGSLLAETGKTKKAEAAYGEALKLEKALVSAYPRRPEYRHALAASYLNLASLLNATGRSAEAEKALREALAVSKQLVAECPKVPEYRQDVARCHNNLAVLLTQTGRPGEAETAWRDAATARRQLVAQFATVPDYQKDLAATLMNLGTLLRDTDQPKEAQAALGEAVALGNRLAAEAPNRPDFRHDLAKSQYNLAILLHKTGQSREAERTLRESLAYLKALAAVFPDQIEYRHSLAKNLVVLGLVLSDAVRPREAEAACREAHALLKPLAAKFSDRPGFRQDLAVCENNLGNLLHNQGRPDMAEAAWRRAQAIQEKLVADFPNRPDYFRDLAGTLYSLGLELHLTHRDREAEEKWREGLARRRHLAAKLPQAPEYQHDVADSLTSLATLLRVTGRPGEAEANYQEALTLGKRLTAEYPNRPDFLRGLGLTWNNLGVLFTDLRRYKEAEAACNEALTLWKKLAADFPGRPGVLEELARTLNNWGVVLARMGRPREAELALRDARARWKKLAADFSGRPDFRREFARTCDGLARLLLAAHRPQEANAALGEALAVREKLAVDFPAVPDFRNELAGTLASLANAHRQRKQFSAAVELLERARPHHDAALAAGPTNPTYRGSFRFHLIVLAGSRLGLGDHARLAATAEELARLGVEPAADTYNAARYMGLCATLAAKDSKPAPAEQTELARDYSDRALALLRQAFARGWRDTSRLKQDPAFQPLQARPEFRQLLADLERKARQ
jgi:serine/threonine protein kinase/tetratricopeptide (TPR) repeat protein